jgi:regulator of protease activity HflC (stomatin/prohibitin superfamily)
VLGILFLVSAVAVFFLLEGAVRLVAGGLVVLGAILLFVSCLRVVDAGHAGIPVTFGSVGGELSPGVKIVTPWTGVTQMSVRTEEYTMSATSNEGDKGGDDSVEVKGADGATGHIDATVLYHLDEQEASEVYRSLGTNYVNKLIRPTSRTCIRKGFSETQLVAAATSARDDVVVAIEDCIRKTVEPRGIVIEEFQLRDTRLDEEVQKSIDAKVAAQQQAEQQVFELQKAERQAEIRRVDSQGISDGQQIVACGAHLELGDDGEERVVPNTRDQCNHGLTENYLQWYYIETLKQLVDSPNNSTVVLPFDQNLVPLLPLESGK